MSESTGSKPASGQTAAQHRAVLEALPFADERDFEDARRGFIGALDQLTVVSDRGRVAYSLEDYGFLSEKEAPDTVNPSLWRMARLNMSHGLFKVADRVYQVRGYDLANMTIVEGDSGLVVLDTMTTVESARASLALYYQHRPQRPVLAVVYSHSHADHYGGVRGLVDEREVQAGRVQIIAPDRFIEEVSSENVIAGLPMVRRAQYQFGPTLPKGPRGQVDAGVGKVSARGTISLIPPTLVIRDAFETHRIDGVELTFQLTPDTEAPANMNVFLPGLKTIYMADNALQCFHNVYPLRGAEVRDANAWARHLDEARHRFARGAEAACHGHNWPVWGAERIDAYLARHRDMFKYIHDQTVRLMNKGYAAADIAEVLEIPASLAGNWSTREYYGTVSHNAKAVYQRYLGWYDGNPANLAPLPPVERARKLVEYMGGADAVLDRTARDFEAGEYRWVADAMNLVVQADPSNARARALAADALEQLGYQTESATWRNAYLLGALELRQGTPGAGGRTMVSPDVVRALSVPLMLDYLATSLDGPRADGRHIVVNWSIADTGERYALNLQHGALTYLESWHNPDADVTVTLEKDVLGALVTGQRQIDEALASGDLGLAGAAAVLAELFGLIDTTRAIFAVIEPRRG